MAVRKLYTVAYIAFWQNRISDVVFGFTVARSEDEVVRIVRAHVPPNKKFHLYKSWGVAARPKTVREQVGFLLEHDFEWLDPRPKHERGDPSSQMSVPDLVHHILTRDAAC